MKTGRSVGIASVAWAIPAFLMCGSGLAWADELADLRANQELLQRRVDQLAQVPPPPLHNEEVRVNKYYFGMREGMLL